MRSSLVLAVLLTGSTGCDFPVFGQIQDKSFALFMDNAPDPTRDIMAYLNLLSDLCWLTNPQDLPSTTSLPGLNQPPAKVQAMEGGVTIISQSSLTLKITIYWDSDGDGLTDIEEAVHGTDPLNPDSDSGGELDGSEILADRDPLSDEDDRNIDEDRDGLYRDMELLYGLDPKERDSDGGGEGDGAEVEAGRDPFDPSDDLKQDRDEDGLSTAEEERLGTDPILKDTDGGGESDGSEVLGGRDPLDGTDDLDPIAQARVIIEVSEGGKTFLADLIMYHFNRCPLSSPRIMTLTSLDATSDQEANYYITADGTSYYIMIPQLVPLSWTLPQRLGPARWPDSGMLGFAVSLLNLNFIALTYNFKDIEPGLFQGEVSVEAASGSVNMSFSRGFEFPLDPL